MMLNNEERRFLEEVVFSDENRQRDFDRWVSMMEEDYANVSFFCNVAYSQDLNPSGFESFLLSENIRNISNIVINNSPA